jgi:hypothetical protein
MVDVDPCHAPDVQVSAQQVQPPAHCSMHTQTASLCRGSNRGDAGIQYIRVVSFSPQDGDNTSLAPARQECCQNVHHPTRVYEGGMMCLKTCARGVKLQSRGNSPPPPPPQKRVLACPYLSVGTGAAAHIDISGYMLEPAL